MRSLVKSIWHLIPASMRYGLWAHLESYYMKKRTKNDQRYDRFYNISTMAVRSYEGTERERALFSDPARMQSTPYNALYELRNKLNLSSDDKFLDIGCGTGRGCFVFADSPIQKLVGFDFDPIAINLANQNLKNYKGDQTKISFKCCDAAIWRFTDETVIYMSNPFGQSTMSQVLNNLAKNLRENPRKMRISYFNPVLRYYLQSFSWLDLVDEVKSLKKPILVYEVNLDALDQTKVEVD